MPKDKVSEKLIPKIYRRKYEDMAMYFFVEGQRLVVPAMTIEQGLYNFYCFIREDDFNIDSALRTFQRIRKEYNENTKTHQ